MWYVRILVCWSIREFFCSGPQTIEVIILSFLYLLLIFSLSTAAFLLAGTYRAICNILSFLSGIDMPLLTNLSYFLFSYLALHYEFSIFTWSYDSKQHTLQHHFALHFQLNSLVWTQNYTCVVNFPHWYDFLYLLTRKDLWVHIH